MLLTNVLRPDSPLRCLELSPDNVDGLFSNIEFASLPKLEHFCIGRIELHEKCQAMIRVL